MQPNNTISQPGLNGPITPTAQIPQRITNRQTALLIARLAVSSLLIGSPDPASFDRADLRLAGAVLGEMMAETELEAPNV